MPPFRLALATIMQYVEGLTDRQTALFFFKER